MTSMAVDVSQMKNISIGLIIALLVGAVVVGLLVRSLVTKLVLVALLVGLGVVVWTQRSNLSDCQASYSFFGYDLSVDNDLQQRCEDVTGATG